MPLNYILIVVFIFLFNSCAPEQQPEPVTLKAKVEKAIDEDRYEDALSLLRSADEADPEVEQLQLATHMTYAIWLTYQADHDMRERMPQALRHYRRVLEFDPVNARAKAEIDQIEGIYQSLNRPVPDGIAER